MMYLDITKLANDLQTLGIEYWFEDHVQSIRINFPGYTVEVYQTGIMFVQVKDKEVRLGEEFWRFIDLINTYRKEAVLGNAVL